MVRSFCCPAGPALPAGATLPAGAHSARWGPLSTRSAPLEFSLSSGSHPGRLWISAGFAKKFS